VDEATKTALAQFQGAHGLPKAGAIDDATPR
jgi:murein L,D-transpeptidase YcbB/YkuD